LSFPAFADGSANASQSNAVCKCHIYINEPAVFDRANAFGVHTLKYVLPHLAIQLYGAGFYGMRGEILMDLQLFSISEGAKAKVKRLLSEGAMRRRLRDIGVVEGTVMECLHAGPFGDPKAYLVRGAVIALRQEESSQIMVEGCDEYDE
jgi:ferrous iron transport protein A